MEHYFLTHTLTHHLPPNPSQPNQYLWSWLSSKPSTATQKDLLLLHTFYHPCLNFQINQTFLDWVGAVSELEGEGGVQREGGGGGGGGGGGEKKGGGGGGGLREY